MSASNIFCSIIIPTIGRDSLARAVESVLNQQFDQPYEVIVVNDSARPLPTGAWQAAAAVQIVDTQQRERSVARNVGAAIARGRFLHFLDDDDWLLPGALDMLARMAANSPAEWLYGAAQLTDARGRCLFQFDHRLSGNCLVQVMAGEWVPLQASMIATTAFFAIGGFQITYAGIEDKDLLLRMALRYDLAGTATPVAGILRGTWSSSTNWTRITHNWREVSEQVLNQPRTLARLRASVHDDAYWQGRLLRLYLISGWWNARLGRPVAGLARLTHAVGALLRAGPRLFSSRFWRALTRAHLTAGFDPASKLLGQDSEPIRSRPAG